jgi:hypothetical protein
MGETGVMETLPPVCPPPASPSTRLGCRAGGPGPRAGQRWRRGQVARAGFRRTLLTSSAPGSVRVHRIRDAIPGVALDEREKARHPAGMPESRLVEVTLSGVRRLSWREQFFGRSHSQAEDLTVSTPAGVFKVVVDAQGCSVGGPCTVTVPLTHPVAITKLKRGVVGSVEGATLRIQRPRFGWRRAARSIEIEAVGIELQTHYTASRRYRISRRSDGSTLYERRGKQALVDQEGSPCEVATAIALEVAGVLSSSSLVDFLTF